MPDILQTLEARVVMDGTAFSDPPNLNFKDQPHNKGLMECAGTILWCSFSLGRKYPE